MLRCADLQGVSPPGWKRDAEHTWLAGGPATEMGLLHVVRVKVWKFPQERSSAYKLPPQPPLFLTENGDEEDFGSADDGGHHNSPRVL